VLPEERHDILDCPAVAPEQPKRGAYTSGGPLRDTTTFPTRAHVELWVCPRCDGNGSDPRLTDQSCLVCWGERTINLNEPVWDGQNMKALETLLGEHGRRAARKADA
jgi:hypothetical protein